MKFKIVKGTPLFDRFCELKKKMDQCNEAARKFSKKVGGYNYASDKAAGGIRAVHFYKKPDLWKSVGKSWQQLYFPTQHKSNKALLKEIAELPVVDIREINKLINFPDGLQVGVMQGGLSVIEGPTEVCFSKSVVLVEVSDLLENYKPAEGMIEILSSEYSELKKK